MAVKSSSRSRFPSKASDDVISICLKARPKKESRGKVLPLFRDSSKGETKGKKSYSTGGVQLAKDLSSCSVYFWVPFGLFWFL